MKLTALSLLVVGIATFVMAASGQLSALFTQFNPTGTTLSGMGAGLPVLTVGLGIWFRRNPTMATYVDTAGGLPAQYDSVEAKALHRWLENQRRSHDTGRLARDKVEALDKLGEWGGKRRGNTAELWTTRLREMHRLRTDTGRFPTYDPERRPDEKVLAVWLGRQRTWQRKGHFRSDRRQRLDALLPGWLTP